MLGPRRGERWQESGYVFTTRTGRQVEPRNIYRSFTRSLSPPVYV
ncbi:Phage integrase [Streptomyces albidoflavus]|nr:Phage integrase [Streptomyces albidoflavus]